MPINEGVIFANHQDREAVRKFFRCYLATYLQIERHPIVRAVIHQCCFGGARALRGRCLPDGDGRAISLSSVFTLQLLSRRRA
jgi:hypothetical protein